MTTQTTGGSAFAEHTGPEHDAFMEDYLRVIDPVNQRIIAEYSRLEAIVDTPAGKREYITVRGEMHNGCRVQMLVDPGPIAQIMLDYDYPVYRVLLWIHPRGMWEAIARYLGFRKVFPVQI